MVLPQDPSTDALLRLSQVNSYNCTCTKVGTTGPNCGGLIPRQLILAKTKLTGAALKGSKTRVRSKFSIELFDQFGEAFTKFKAGTKGLFAASISQTSSTGATRVVGVVTIDYVGKNTFKGSYGVWVSGNYTMSVGVRAGLADMLSTPKLAHLPGSPFKLVVADTIGPADALQSTLSGAQGIDAPLAGEKAALLVKLSDSYSTALKKGGDKVVAVLGATSPGGISLSSGPHTVDRKDGSYAIAFIATVAGTYHFNVSVNGKQLQTQVAAAGAVAGSMLIHSVTVSPASVDARRCLTTLRSTTAKPRVGIRSAFNITARDAFDNNAGPGTTEAFSVTLKSTARPAPTPFFASRSVWCSLS